MNSGDVLLTGTHAIYKLFFGVSFGETLPFFWRETNSTWRVGNIDVTHYPPANIYPCPVLLCLLTAAGMDELIFFLNPIKFIYFVDQMFFYIWEITQVLI
jgi:hypothetical protein